MSGKRDEQQNGSSLISVFSSFLLFLFNYFCVLTHSFLNISSFVSFHLSSQGDSGGPLVVTTNDGGVVQHVQVGIISWGIGCGREEFPGVYSRISRGYPWIKRQVCEYSKNPPSSFGCASSSSSTATSASG